MNGCTDQRMDGPMDGQYFSLTQMQYTHLKMMIFEQILQFLQKRYGSTDGPGDQEMDQQTDQRKDIPSYRDAIAHLKTEPDCNTTLT